MALELPVTEEDARTLYRVILGREPESEQVVQTLVASGCPAGEAVHNFLTSAEYSGRAVPAGAQAIWAAPEGGNVDFTATPEQLDAMRAHVADVWSAYGREQTYWSVLTAQQFRDEAIDEAAIDEFYRSGLAGYDNVARLLRRNGVDFTRIGSVLDFGCGVGRVAQPFANAFGRYIGVDISPGHLRLAREWADKAQLADAQFMLMQDFLTSDIRYDLFYSLIVLQHNPPPIMLEMLRAGLSRVKPGGYAFFQIPGSIFGAGFSADRYLAGEGLCNSMEMHALPQRAVFAELAANGFSPLEVVPDPHIGAAGVSYVYIAEKAR